MYSILFCVLNSYLIKEVCTIPIDEYSLISILRTIETYFMRVQLLLLLYFKFPNNKVHLLTEIKKLTISFFIVCHTIH